jgi:hypothetical protein
MIVFFLLEDNKLLSLPADRAYILSTYALLNNLPCYRPMVGKVPAFAGMTLRMQETL